VVRVSFWPVVAVIAVIAISLILIALFPVSHTRGYFLILIVILMGMLAFLHYSCLCLGSLKYLHHLRLQPGCHLCL